MFFHLCGGCPTLNPAGKKGTFSGKAAFVFVLSAGTAKAALSNPGDSSAACSGPESPADL